MTARSRRRVNRRVAWVLALVVAAGNAPFRGPSTVAAAAPPGDTVSKLVAHGIESYQAAKYQEALKTLETARGLAPDFSPIALYLGLAHLRLGETKEAIEAWRRYP